VLLMESHSTKSESKANEERRLLLDECDRKGDDENVSDLVKLHRSLRDGSVIH
jgi:hypothetical protein